MKQTKPTWEDVPGILAQILDAVKNGGCSCSGKAAAAPAEPAGTAEIPVVEEQAPQTTEEITDRKAVFNSILTINRANPDMRQKIRAIVSSLTPTGDGKFDDVPDSKLMDLKTQIEAVNV